MKTIVAIILLLTTYFSPYTGQASAAKRVTSDTLSFHFRQARIGIDLNYANNRATWNHFKRQFQEHFIDKDASDITVDIYSGASPEGSVHNNRWLAESRGNSIRDLIRREYGQRIGHIYVHNKATTWDDFYDVIAATREPWRDQVLSILKQPASQDTKKIDHRETQLRRLWGGRLWPILLKKYLPALRSGTSAVIRLESERDTVYMKPAPVAVPVYVKPQRDTIVISRRDTVYIHQTIVKNIYHHGDSVVPDSITYLPVTRQPAWILRSNLPFLCVGTANLQGEWSLDHRDRWSFNLEGMWSWFTLSHHAYSNQLMYGSVELRHWLGNRRRHHTLDGFHIGLGVGGGYGDLGWKSKGYQFEVVMGYVNIGWQHRYGKRQQWAFDAGLGLGFAYIPYRRYYGSSIYPENRTEEYDYHLMWLETSHRDWIGPTHLNLSIGYVFTSEKSAFRRASANHRDELHRQFNDASDRLEQRLAAERDSVYRSWMSLPKAERRAAQKAYNKRVKEAREEARRQAVTARRNYKANEKRAKKEGRAINE